MSSVSGTGDRNYLDMLGSAGTESTTATNTYNAVVSNSSEDDGISIDDFFSIMITQLTNQDFMNPQSDTEYFSQMAQFYSMQAMKEVTAYSEQNYAVSLVGKTVTASKYGIGGSVTKETGVVDSVTMKDGDYTFSINGNSFTLSQISQVSDTVQTDSATDGDGETE